MPTDAAAVIPAAASPGWTPVISHSGIRVLSIAAWSAAHVQPEPRTARGLQSLLQVQ
ncbi:hypothetical protein ACFQX6_10005 [Streptosporangium lutulentum]